MAPEFDPRDVLETYVALLSKPGNAPIRDVSELAHSKDEIKAVLQHCIKVAVDAQALDFLRDSYLALASFQHMSEQERGAAALLAEIGTPALVGSELFQAQARRISAAAPPLQSVLDRFRAELAVLTQELTLLPGPMGASEAG
jgi:hypothetical protein